MIQLTGIVVDDSNNVSGITSLTASILKATGGVEVEDPDAGTNKVTIVADTTLSSDVTMTLPKVTGTFASLAGTETLENKTLKADLVDDYLAINHESDPAAASAGTVRLYAKNDNSLYVMDPAGVSTPVGSSTGQGEKNYILNPSAKSATTGWVASSANITIARTTTAANCPRENTTGTAVSLTSSTDEAYAYYRFTLDDVDLSKKLKAVLAFINADTSDAWRIEMWKNSASNYSGTYTELSLSTDSSGDSYLPVTTGEYKTTFDTDTTAWLELRIVHNTTNSDVLYISDVIVGPGSVVTGAVIEPSILVTMTTTNVTSTITAYSSRSGNKATINARIAATGNASNSVVLNMPSGYTIDTSSLPSNTAVGAGLVYDSSTAVYYSVIAYVASSTQIGFTSDGEGLVGTNDPGPDGFDNGDILSVEFTVPIAEWAGSGTVNLAANDVEYAASTTGTWDADAAAGNTVYGPVGALISGSLTANRSKVVRFSSPIQVTDKIVLEFYSGGVWREQSSYAPYIGLPGIDIGCWLYQASGTDVTVVFFQYFRQGTTYNTSTGAQNWVNGTYWRLRKVSASSVAGFELHKPGVSAGLVPAQGLDGRTDGVAVAAGKVGEVIEGTITNNVTIGTSATTISSDITLSAGSWEIFALAPMSVESGAISGNLTQVSMYIAYGAGNTQIGSYSTLAGAKTNTSSASSIYATLPHQTVHNFTGSAIAVRVRALRSYEVGTGSAVTFGAANSQGKFYAVRIA
jgi:hypothetical protein